MKKKMSTRSLVFGGIAIAAVLGLMASHATVRAADEGHAGIAVGTYSPQMIAQRVGLQEKMMAQMGALQERAMAAQAEQDTEALQQIQLEAQQIEQAVIGEFQADLDGAIPGVAEEAGVQIVAIEVSWTAPGIETVDVSSAIAEALGAPEASMELPELTLPTPQ